MTTAAERPLVTSGVRRRSFAATEELATDESQSRRCGAVVLSQSERFSDSRISGLFFERSIKPEESGSCVEFQSRSHSCIPPS